MTQTVEGFLLSPQQRRLWSLEEGGLGAGLRTVAALDVTGPLDRAALAAALREVTARFEILRTRFRCLEEMTMPLQVVAEEAEVDLVEHDLRGDDEEERRLQLEALVEEQRDTAFDLAAGPLLRVRLATLAADRHVLVLALPALCADLGGLHNLVLELAAAYARIRGAGVDEGEEPIQYADLAQWQHDLLEAEESAAGRGFWAGLDLSAIDARLPGEATAPPGPFRPGRIELDAGAAREPLARLARALALPPETILPAAWAVLLGRVAGRPRVVLGTVADGRRYAELEGAVGLFARTLPVPLELDDRLAFADLAARLAGALEEAASWQEAFSWDRLEAGAGGAFVPWAWEAEPRLPPCGAASGLEIAVREQSCRFDRFSLKLVASGGDPSLALHYDPASLGREAAERLGRRFLALLESAAARPHARLAELDLLAPEERRALLVERNATRVEGPAPGLVHRRFAEQARRTPRATAVAGEDESLSYAETARRAARLAARLRALGVGPDTVVAICGERSAAWIVGLLGILEAGGAYLPIEPGLPGERAAFLLAESGARAVVVGPGAGSVPVGELPVVDLAEAAAAGGERDLDGGPAAPANLAYVLFTSGSTGRPKGVAVEHRQLAAYVRAAELALELPPGGSFASVSTFAADLGNTMVFPALCGGGALHVIGSARLADPEALADRLEAHPVDCLKIVPGHLAALLSGSRPTAVLPRARLVLGGDVLRWELVDRVRELVPGLRIFNHYGPTETTVGALAGAVADLPSPRRPATAPLGRPLPDYRAYVLTAGGAPALAEAAGELFVGGAGVARGYLGRPALTAERFVPDPWGEEPGARLYRTGDLVRQLGDGRLEFLGRADHQVKVRGFRIELGEIEAVLAGHPRVREAAVIATAGDAGDPRLTAFAAARGEDAAGELREWLAARLPEAMLPAAIVTVEELPRTANGKIDRAALAAAADLAEPEPSTPPRTVTEEVIGAIWEDLLGLERVGIDQSFFAVGGHSLLATRLVARVRAELGVELPLAAFLSDPTVAGAAGFVEDRLRDAAGAADAPLEPAERDSEGRAPLSFAQERLWFLHSLLPGSPAYNVPVCLRLVGELDALALGRSLFELVRRHQALRTTFGVAGGRPFQVVGPPRPVPLPTVDLRRLRARRRAVAEELCNAAARVPIDLERGPVLVARLLRLDDREHLLALTTHHIVFDGSLGLFLSELARVYGSLRGGRPAALPELPLQYADFAAWQRRHLAGEAVQAQLEHWRRRLAGAPPLLELPTDRPRPPVQGSRGGRLGFAWPAELVGPLQALARRRASTLYMTVLGGLVGLLYRLSGEADVVVGSPVADRPRPEVEGLVGCFVNTVVLRVGVDPEAPLSRLVDSARDAALEAFVHKDLPFEMLVDAVQPQRSLGHSPLFQVMFVLRAGARAAVDDGAEERRRGPAPGLAFETVQLDRGTARFDLLVSIAEQADGATGAVEYAADLFDESTVRRWMGHLRTLLEAAMERPDVPLDALPLLAPSERHQLLHEWNDTATRESSPLCLHELFALQAERRGDAPAVVWEDGELSYRELAERVQRLARLLRRLGVAPGSLVGVHLERGPDMAAATLAVMAAGGGYVPLDARLPAARVRGILEELGTSVAITCAGGLDALAGVPSLTGAVVLGAAAEGAAAGSVRTWGEADVAAQPAGRLAPAAGPDDVAYVIFTSGSTGRPKGVMVQHRPAVHLIDWVNRCFAVGEDDRLLFVTSLGFDLSVYDLFGPLAAGGSVRVAGEREVGDPDRLVELLRSGEITVWDSAPAALQQLVPALPEPDPGSRLRLVLLSGDWIPLALPGQVRGAFPGARVISLGGATEATIWSNFHEVGEVSPHWVSVPYGRPIPGARYHVSDRRSAPCPPGVAGDLLIGGGCLAAGYAARPRLTAERFVPDPFAVTPGARVYRTGDRARYGAGGVLEILGRLDQQVKVRGFRVELGEVEAALAACPGVREAAVVARGDRFDRRLAAYVVADDPSPAGLQTLRDRLARRLPEYMVPASIVPLERLPTNASGKVDRRALPEPPAVSGASGRRAAATPAEELVAQVFSDVLGVPEVGPEDGFFELGGHSLLAMQALARLREAFASDLPLRRMFEQPTVAGLAAALTDARGDAADPTPLEPRPADAAPVLSPAQERLWFLHQLEPESPAYNVPLAFRFAGRFDASALAAALAEVMRRHEVLRTRYPAAGGRPRPEVMEAVPPPLPRIELAALPAGGRERELQRLAGAEARRPFDLASGPVLRARVIGLGGEGGADTAAERGALLVTVHHIAADAWSMGVLVREVSELYSGHAAGRPAALPALPVQYADYALWQRRRLAAGGLDRELDYWRRTLEGAATIELPTDRPRPAVWSPEGASRPIRYGRDVADAVAALARREGATPFMVLLAAFDVLLARWTGARDLPVGTPVATRSHPAAEPLVGLFLNTLVVRTDAGGDPTFRRLLERVRGATLAAYDRRELPFERLVEELHPRRDLGRSPLFQVLLILHNAPLPALELPGLELSRLEVDKRTARFDWTLTLAPAASGLAGSFEYSAALFDATTVERAAGHLGRLLRAAAEDSDRRLSELPLWGDAERHQVLREWNDSRVPDDPRPVHRQVAEQARRHPGRTAVVDRGRSLSYDELAARVERAAARLAARRAELGAAAGEIKVGLLFERSAEMVVALLAALRSGVAYVPLDPAAPPRRLAAAVADAGLSWVIAGPGTEAARPALGELPVVAFDDSPSPAVGSDERSPEASPEAADPPPDALAYVLFTSGSTGRPKGVQVTHGALANLVRAMAGMHRLRPDEVWAAVTPLTFDISAAEILVPLVSGAAVDLVPREVAADGPALARRLAETGAAVLQATPATWWLLLESGWEGGGLREALCGGEAMPQTVAAGLVERVPAVWNYYGPTETTIWSSVRRVRGAERAGVVPVGRPLAETALAIVDQRLCPLPSGVPGELAIGGAGLARGYLGLPAATAERFVPDTVTGRPGARLYRTGDLARLLPSGDVEFLGRLDQQVKVRGFRIEPGEVEAALTAQPGVRQAVVVARAAGPGDARLVSYLVAADPAAPPEPAELRRALRERLPDYMVPSAFEVLDALPLGATGKVDRRALPEPRPAASHAEAGGPERSAAEEVLAAIWSDVLHHPRIGPEDDFFALGGHSLLATQVVSRVREAFGVEVPVRTLFAAPTLEACAAEIERVRRTAGAVPAAPPLVPESRDGLLPLSFAQQRLWVAEQLGTAVAAYTIPHAVRLEGALRVDCLAAAFGEILRRHEVLRTVYPAERGVPAQRIVPPSPQPLPVVDLSALGPDDRAAEAERAIASQGARRFDLTTGPLLRTRLLRLAAGEHALSITVHHIASDGWSRQVLEGELRRLYAAFAAGRPSPLAEPPIQYADYAAWQRRWLDGPALDAHLEFWRGRLAGMPPTLDLPFDRPRPERPTGRGGRVPFTLPAGLTAALRDLARRRGASLFMVLLAGFSALLRSLTGRDDLVVGTDVANRTRRETEALIGFFVNELVLRSHLPGNLTFGQALERVRETALDAFAHQDLPFERLLDALDFRRTLRHSPLYQVKLILQNAPPAGGDPTAAPDAPVFKPLEVDAGTAKFDLAVFAYDVGDELRGSFNYRSELFDRATVEGFRAGFEAVLAAAVRRPEATLAEISDLITEDERSRSKMQAPTGKRFDLSKIKAAQPKAVAVDQAELVRRGFLAPGRELPLVVEPALADADLASWAAAHRDQVERDLARYGAILFRGFGIADETSFERFAGAVCDELFDENGEHESLGGHVQTPVFYSPEKQLLWHNENSFNQRWPRKILFGCAIPAATGGETTIVDSRRVYRELPDALRRRFEERGVAYLRNAGGGLGRDWRTLFGTDDREQVEQACRRSAVEWEWRDGGERLRTRAVRPATVDHPVTGERCWFNQAQHWHLACLDPETRRSIEAVHSEDDLPRHCTYGDGTPIDDADMAAILDVYRRLEVGFPWHKGDVMLVDNVLVAHGRNPFTGQRKLLVALGDMHGYENGGTPS